MGTSRSEPPVYHDTRGASVYLTERRGVRRTPKTLEKLRCLSGGPEFRRVGARHVLYEQKALDAWADSLISRPFRSTAEAA